MRALPDHRTNLPSGGGGRVAAAIHGGVRAVGGDGMLQTAQLDISELNRRCRAAYQQAVRDRKFGDVGVDVLAFASAGWNPDIQPGEHFAPTMTASLLRAAEVDIHTLCEDAHYRVCLAQGLVEFLLRDPQFGSCIQELIRIRLTALYRFALLGPELLANPENSLWPLLTTLDRLAPLLPEQAEQDRVLWNSVSACLEQCPLDDDLSLFVATLADVLNKFCSQRERRVSNIVRRQINAMRGRERWILARDEAERCVAMALAGHETYPAIRQLLEGLWIDVLTLLVLRNSTNSRQWQAAERTVKALVVLGGTRYRGPRLERLKLHALENNLEVGLTMIGAGQAERAAVARIMAAIRRHQSGGGDHATLQVLVSEADTLARCSEASGSEAKLERVLIEGIGAQRETAVQELCAWPTPMKVRLGGRSDGRTQSLSWVWSHAKTGHCLVVDHTGHAAWTRSLLEAANAYVSGLLIPGDAFAPNAQQRFLLSWMDTLKYMSGADGQRH